MGEGDARSAPAAIADQPDGDLPPAPGRSRTDQAARAGTATDFRLSQHLIDGPDFREGIRAFVIGRDQKPAWHPADLAGVMPAMIDALFAPVSPIPEWTPAD